MLPAWGVGAGWGLGPESWCGALGTTTIWQHLWWPGAPGSSAPLSRTLPCRPCPSLWPHGRCPLPAERTPSPQGQSARLTSPGGRAQRPVVPPRREAVTNATQTRGSRETGGRRAQTETKSRAGQHSDGRPAITFFGFDDRATGGRLGCFGGARHRTSVSPVYKPPHQKAPRRQCRRDFLLNSAHPQSPPTSPQ